MEDRDYRSEVGKKIEEALKVGDFDLIEDLIEVPPMETFMQWAEKGEEKRKKRILRKRILVSCLAIVVVSASVLIGLKCFALPEVTADPDSEVDIELNDMDSVTTYKSWDALPDDIKEQFIEVKELPDGYEVEKVEVKTPDYGAKLKVIIKNENSKVEIRQYISADGVLPTSTVAGRNEKVNIGGIVTYIESDTNYNTSTYKYLVGNIMIDVVVYADISLQDIEYIIETVQ